LIFGGVGWKSYHAFRSRAPSKRTQDNPRLSVAIQAAHVRARETYGPERLRDELRDDGFKAGVSRIKRLRKKRGLRSDRRGLAVCRLKQRVADLSLRAHAMEILLTKKF